MCRIGKRKAEKFEFQLLVDIGLCQRMPEDDKVGNNSNQPDSSSTNLFFVIDQLRIFLSCYIFFYLSL